MLNSTWKVSTVYYNLLFTKIMLVDVVEVICGVTAGGVVTLGCIVTGKIWVPAGAQVEWMSGGLIAVEFAPCCTTMKIDWGDYLICSDTKTLLLCSLFFLLSLLRDYHNTWLSRLLSLLRDDMIYLTGQTVMRMVQLTCYVMRLFGLVDCYPYDNP